MGAKEIVEQVIGMLQPVTTNEQALDITDKVFLTIQNDHDLMYQFLKAVESNGLDTVKKNIGREVKTQLNLENLEQERNPESTLIRSYTKHCLNG